MALNICHFYCLLLTENQRLNGLYKTKISEKKKITLCLSKIFIERHSVNH